MARRVDPAQLVGAAEIAERLHMKQNHIVHEWRRRYADFPEPIAILKQGMVWLWPEIEQWARRTGRLDVPTATPRRRRP